MLNLAPSMVNEWAFQWCSLFTQSRHSPVSNQTVLLWNAPIFFLAFFNYPSLFVSIPAFFERVAGISLKNNYLRHHIGWVWPCVRSLIISHLQGLTETVITLSCLIRLFKCQILAGKVTKDLQWWTHDITIVCVCVCVFYSYQIINDNKAAVLMIANLWPLCAFILGSVLAMSETWSCYQSWENHSQLQYMCKQQARRFLSPQTSCFCLCLCVGKVTQALL